MLFAQETRSSAVSGQKENTRCRILPRCRKQLQAPLDHIETIECANLKTAISKSSLRPAQGTGLNLCNSPATLDCLIFLFRGARHRGRTAPQWNSSCDAGRGYHRTSWNKIRIPNPVPAARREAGCPDGHSRKGSWVDRDYAFHSAAEELVSTGDEAIAVRSVCAFKVLEAIECTTTEYDIEPQN